MSEFSVEDVMKREAGKAERPSAYPPGTYLMEVASVKRKVIVPKKGQNTGKKVPLAEVYFKPVKAVEVAEPVDMEKRRAQPKQSFWLTDGDLWRMDEFFATTLGMDIGGQSYEDLFTLAVGRECQGYLSLRDEDRYNEIEQLAPAA